MHLHQPRMGGEVMPRPKIEPEPAPDYSTLKKLPKDFAALVRERREIATLIAELESRKDEITEVLVPAFIAAKADRIGVDGVAAVLVTGTSTKIDGRKLLEKGVPSTVIQYATIRATYQYINPGKIKAEAEGNESYTE